MEKIILGSIKDFSVYLGTVVLYLERYGEVEISGMGNNIGKAERIRSLLRSFGVKEKARRYENIRDSHALVIHLALDDVPMAVG